MKYKTLCMLFISLAFFVTKSNAGIIYESANLGTMGDIGSYIGSDQFVGSRFSINSAYEVTGFGGHLLTNFGSVWGAIIALPDSSSSSLPSFYPNSIEQHAIVYGLFDTNGTAVDTRVNTNILLDAGDYALIFGGSGWFGATGDGSMAISGNGMMGYYDSGQISSATASYFHTNSEYVNGSWEVQGWQHSNELYSAAPRFVIEGNSVSVNEPATLSLFLLAVMFVNSRSRKRSSS